MKVIEGEKSHREDNDRSVTTDIITGKGPQKWHFRRR